MFIIITIEQFSAWDYFRIVDDGKTKTAFCTTCEMKKLHPIKKYNITNHKSTPNLVTHLKTHGITKNLNSDSNIFDSDVRMKVTEILVSNCQRNDMLFLNLIFFTYKREAETPI